MMVMKYSPASTAKPFFDLLLSRIRFFHSRPFFPSQLNHFRINHGKARRFNTIVNWY